MIIKQPNKSQGKAVHQLIKETGGLDLNSVYYYYIMCDFYAKTSAIALDDNNKVVGYLSGLIPPEEPKTLFIWQVAVSPKAQGQGLSKKMLQHVIDNNPNCDTMKTTIGPENGASQGLFKSIAKSQGANIQNEEYLGAEELGDHEPEILFNIKPINQ